MMAHRKGSYLPRSAMTPALHIVCKWLFLYLNKASSVPNQEAAEN